MKVNITEAAYIVCYDLALIRSALSTLNQCARTDANESVRTATKLLSEREMELTKSLQT